MALFQPSTLPIVSAITQIADAAGASGDTDHTTRALQSLAAAFKYFNTKYKWNWLETEATPIAVVGPFTAAVAVSAGQASATAAAGHGIDIDDQIVGSGFRLGTRATATASTAIGFNLATTSTAAGVIATTVTSTRDLYTLPSDYKAAYSVKLLSQQVTLTPIVRRIYDRAVWGPENAATLPQWYDTFQVGAKGKLRILQPSPVADTLLLRYHRRMTIPSASADVTVMDIPQDYDPHVIAWAKWHFLTDKGNPERASTWMSLATEGLKMMLADQTQQPDDDIGFVPGHSSVWYGPNDIRPWIGEPG